MATDIQIEREREREREREGGDGRRETDRQARVYLLRWMICARIFDIFYSAIFGKSVSLRYTMKMREMIMLVI